MRKVVGTAALALVAMVALSSCSVAMGDLGGAWSAAADINASGVAAGNSDTTQSTPTNQVFRGFRRAGDGTIVELAPLTGHKGTTAAAINDAGTIAGSSWTHPPIGGFSSCPQAGLPRAATWATNGTVSDLGVLPGGCTSEAFDINATGVVVGSANVGSFAPRAFVYDPAVGHIAQLPSLPGADWTIAEAINDAGKVVGRQWLPGGVAVVIWDLAAGTVTNVTAQVGLTRINDINDAGVIAGAVRATAPDGSSTTEAAIWTPGATGPTLLGVGLGSSAASINESGVVLGTVSVLEPSEPGPIVTPPGWVYDMFRWEVATGAVNLAGIDHESSGAAINDAGQMVGQVDGRAVFFYLDG